MATPSPLIIHEADDVTLALAQIGLSRETVTEISREAASARAEALPVDPASTGGWLSYIFGIRHLRLTLLPEEGWRLARPHNIESTINDDLGIQLCFQNVDSACDPNRIPRAISRKGTACRDLVAAGQADLFDQGLTTIKSKHGTTPTVWTICVEASDKTLKAEVSCPTNFTGDQFEDFHTRIFVVDEPFEDVTTSTNDDFGDGDLDVPVTKR